MHTKVQIFWLITLMLFSLQIASSSATEKNIPIDVNFSNVDFKKGLLRVSVENQKFKKVMGEVAQKAGIRILINGPADEDLTIHFDYLPLDKGLKKLLRGRNYVFLYRSAKAHQSSRLMRVLVLPKADERSEANIKGRTKSRSARRTGQKEIGEKMQNVNQKSLDEILEVFSQSGMEINAEMMQEIRDLGEMGEEFFKALEMIQKMEGFEQLMGFEDKAETNVATQPKQRGPVGEMQNVDQRSLDEIYKALSEDKAEFNQ